MGLLDYVTKPLHITDHAEKGSDLLKCIDILKRKRQGQAQNRSLLLPPQSFPAPAEARAMSASLHQVEHCPGHRQKHSKLGTESPESQSEEDHEQVL